MATATLTQHRFFLWALNWQARDYLLCLILLTIILFNLVGCVVIPIPSTKALEEKPFHGEQTAIVIGVTTKEEVENLLDAPDAKRRSGSIYIYAKPYIYGYLYALSSQNENLTRLEKHHLLILQFDKNGIVKDVDLIVGKGGWTKNGIFVADTGLRPKEYLSSYPKPETSIEQMLVLYSNSFTELNAAQRFIAPYGKAVIYLYREELSFLFPEFKNEKVSVSLDCIALGDFGEEGFFYWTVDPGNHSITVTPLWPGQEGQAGQWHSASISIECKEGQIYFIEQTWEREGLFKQQFKVHLTIVSDQSTGRQEVLKRKMVLDCLSQGD